MKVAVLLLAVLGVAAADTKLWYTYPSPVVGSATTYTAGGHVFPATTYYRRPAVAPSAFQYHLPAAQYHLPAAQYSVPVMSAPAVVGPTVYQYPAVGSAVVVGSDDDDDDDDDNDRHGGDDDDDDDMMATFYGAYYHDDD